MLHKIGCIPHALVYCTYDHKSLLISKAVLAILRVTRCTLKRVAVGSDTFLVEWRRRNERTRLKPREGRRIHTRSFVHVCVCCMELRCGVLRCSAISVWYHGAVLCCLEWRWVVGCGLWVLAYGLGFGGCGVGCGMCVCGGGSRLEMPCSTMRHDELQSIDWWCVV